MTLPKNHGLLAIKKLNKKELYDFLCHYDIYIQDANEKDLYHEGWRPVCMGEFYDCEYQDILENNKEKPPVNCKECFGGRAACYGCGGQDPKKINKCYQCSDSGTVECYYCNGAGVIS